MTTPEGRASFQNNVWSDEFSYSDHLGNTRVSFRALGNSLVKVAETAFDPFGVVLKDIGKVNGTSNRWEMQEHEKESTFGLNRVNFGNRVYNPTNGRFDRSDKYSEKYSGLSNFQYSANNPMRFIDVNGDSLWVSSNGANYYFGFTNTGGYGFYDSNGNLYSGTDKFVTSVANAISRLTLAKEGNGMVAMLMKDAKNIIISESRISGGNLQGNATFNNSYLINGKNFDLAVRWSENNINGGTDQNNSTVRPAYIGLGHEFSHVESYITNRFVAGLWINDTVTPIALDNDDIYATHRENQLRKENGLPLRVEYSPGYSNSRIIDNAGTSLYIDKNGHYYLDKNNHARKLTKSEIPFKY